MKKLIALIAVLLMTLTAFAGPLLGLSIWPGTKVTPTSVTNATLLTVGWDFGSVSVEAFKGNLATPYGVWDFGILWTPQQGSFGYRAGAKLSLNWKALNKTVVYNGFYFVLGVSNTWGPIRLFAEVDLAPTGLLIVIPVVGVNILFEGLIPSGNDVGL